MKKTLLVLLASGFGFFASAQSFVIGLKGGEAATYLLNPNVLSTGNEENYASTMTGEFGLHLEINFLGGTGIEGEIITESLNQKYKGSFSNGGVTTYPIYYQNGESYTAETKLSEIKIPILFHFQTIGGFAFEVGPEFATISNATYSASYSGQPAGQVPSLSYGDKSAFASSGILGVLGIGWNFKLIPSGKLYLMADLRLEYGFTDLKGVDALGQDLNNSSTNGLYASNSGVAKPTITYGGYSGTHSAEASLSLGLFYRISLLPKVL